ncbi:MAG: PLD nuclease N-terminal domain-containing protein [Jatrophihabitans sp.]
MVFFSGAFGLVALAVWIFCIIDAVTTPRDQVRNLPKLAWILVVILFVDVGSIAWLLAGRPWSQRAMARSGAGSGGGLTSMTGQPRRRPARPTNPDDDEEFLATLKLRADEQRRRTRDASGEDEPDGDTPPPDRRR